MLMQQPTLESPHCPLLDMDMSLDLLSSESFLASDCHLIKSLGEPQAACRGNKATCQQLKVLLLARDTGVPMQLAQLPWPQAGSSSSEENFDSHTVLPGVGT